MSAWDGLPIPDDIRETAADCVPIHMIGQIQATKIGMLVERALLAERERCAKIAIRLAPSTQDWADAPLQDLAKRIASAIRNPRTARKENFCDHPAMRYRP